MSRLGRIVFFLLALAALISTACATNVGSARVSARIGTRIPGTVYSGADGTPHQIEPVEPRGDALFLIVRGRY